MIRCTLKSFMVSCRVATAGVTAAPRASQHRHLAAGIGPGTRVLYSCDPASPTGILALAFLPSRATMMGLMAEPWPPHFPTVSWQVSSPSPLTWMLSSTFFHWQNRVNLSLGKMEDTHSGKCQGLEVIRSCPTHCPSRVLTSGHRDT